MWISNHVLDVCASFESCMLFTWFTESKHMCFHNVTGAYEMITLHANISCDLTSVAYI